MAAVEGSYAAEVSSARQRIKLLKDRLTRRAAARQAFAAGKPFGAQPGQHSAEGDAAEDAAAEAVVVLKRLVASHLLHLDVSQLPTDSQTIQKKVMLLSQSHAYSQTLVLIVHTVHTAKQR